MKDDVILYGIALLPSVIAIETGIILLLYSFTISPPFQDPVQIAELMRNGEVYLI